MAAIDIARPKTRRGVCFRDDRSLDIAPVLKFLMSSFNLGSFTTAPLILLDKKRGTRGSNVPVNRYTVNRERDRRKPHNFKPEPSRRSFTSRHRLRTINQKQQFTMHLARLVQPSNLRNGRIRLKCTRTNEPSSVVVKEPRVRRRNSFGRLFARSDSTKSLAPQEPTLECSMSTLQSSISTLDMSMSSINGDSPVRLADEPIVSNLEQVQEVTSPSKQVPSADSVQSTGRRRADYKLERANSVKLERAKRSVKLQRAKSVKGLVDYSTTAAGEKPRKKKRTKHRVKVEAKDLAGFLDDYAKIITDHSPHEEYGGSESVVGW